MCPEAVYNHRNHEMWRGFICHGTISGLMEKGFESIMYGEGDQNFSKIGMKNDENVNFLFINSRT
jgi:hypothetical protein